MNADIAGRWVRVSTGGQDEKNQEPQIDGWISDRAYRVGPTYRLHGKSASKGKHQTELDKVVADMQAGLITVLVVWHSSRIERRGAWNAFDLARRVREAGGRIEYVQEPMLNDATNEMSDVALAMAATQNRMYSTNLSKYVGISFDRIDANGAIRNRAGYGHRVAGGEKYNKRFELDEAEAEVIRLAVTRYLSGQSLAHVCRWLTANGHMGRNGAAFTPKTLGKILRSDSLIGRYHQGDVVARVPSIITVKQHNAVKARLDAKAYRQGIRTRADTALLTSILHCGKCGRAMYKIRGGGQRSINGHTRKRIPHGKVSPITYNYYCRPRDGVSCHMLIPLAETDREFILEWGAQIYVRHSTREITIPGHDYQDDIDLIAKDIQALDPRHPDWLARVTGMQAEIARLALLEPEPDEVRTVEVDTVAAANEWQQLPDAEKRQRIIDLGVKLWAVKDAGGNVDITDKEP